MAGTPITSPAPGSNPVTDLATFDVQAGQAALNNPNAAVQIANIALTVNEQVVLDVAAGNNAAAIVAIQSGATRINQLTATPCYCEGTLIRTVAGDVAVEGLAVGDVVVTSSGQQRPISWLGSRTVECRRHPRQDEAMPVRIAANAFGDNRPARDLLVSPGHSLCIDIVGEVLIPAVALVNGTTIIQEDVDRVTYWHVELEDHDILLAENMPAESYLDMSNRSFFADSDVVDLDASPDAQRVTHAEFCRPFHADGALVEVVRAQLASRAAQLGWRLEDRGLRDFYLLVDGVKMEPSLRGLSAGFIVPAGAGSVWLVSGGTIPAEISPGVLDRRPLGLCISALRIENRFGVSRTMALDDPSLCVGFHDIERDGNAAWRWTIGRARLPASLFDGLSGDLFLRIDLASPPLPRWTSPVGDVEEAAPAFARTA